MKTLVYIRGSQPGVHVAVGVHLRLALEAKIYLFITSLFIHISVNIIFKFHYILVAKYTYDWS